MTPAERIKEAQTRAKAHTGLALVDLSSVIDSTRERAKIRVLLAIEARLDEANAIAGLTRGM